MRILALVLLLTGCGREMVDEDMDAGTVIDAGVPITVVDAGVPMPTAAERCLSECSRDSVCWWQSDGCHKRPRP